MRSSLAGASGCVSNRESPHPRGVAYLKIWSFLFPEPSWPLVSARVAAPDKAGAALLLGAALGRNLAGSRPGAPVADGVICQYLGQEDRAVGVVSAVARRAA